MSDSHNDNQAQQALAILQRGDLERPAERRGMAPVVAAILERNPNAETLREVLAVQREWEREEARKAYAAALVGLKRDLPTVIERDGKVDYTPKNSDRVFYRHATLAHVMDKITSPLTDHGFSLAWKPKTGEDGVTVTCRLTHQAGHFEECTLSAPPDAKGGKGAAQAVASTITLLSRYAALSLLGIATRDMPEAIGEETPADPAKIDSDRNLKVVGWLLSKGRKSEDAEKFLGKKVADWTAADLEALKAWAKTAAAQ